ncbi:prostaglandin E synthase 2 [Planococcus citri]|uniref:prostaglandin E synthase 2 n=1 Tax=Planococcus citri TaxID=170843 RepID=UPI0031F75FD8
MSFMFASRVAFRHLNEVNKCFFNHNLRRFVATKPNERKTHNLKAALTGVAIGVLAGGGYSFYQKKEPDFSANVRIVQNNDRISSFPKVEISRKIVVPNDASGLEVTLFQYPTCPFCCKVRAFLDFYGISYDVVEVNPVLKQQMKWTDYKKVPIVLIKSGNKYLQFKDSTMIISGLATYFRDKHIGLDSIQEYYPISQDSDNPKKIEIMNKYFVMDGQRTEKALERDKDERKWRKWADDVLVHMLSPNVYRTTDEALQAFNWFSEVGEWDKLFSGIERAFVIYVGAFVMWMIGKKLQKKYHLKEDVRQSLYDECNKLMKELETRGTPFLGGQEPNLADLAIYGILSSIEGCLAFRELLENTNIGSWFFKMKDAAQKHDGQKLLM